MVDLELEKIRETVAKYRELPREERINFINREYWIGYPKAQQGIMKLIGLMNYPKRSRMPNLLILSPTNNGKTLLVKRFMNYYSPECSKELGVFTKLCQF